MFYMPQVTKNFLSGIISFFYELPNKLPSNVRLKDPRNPRNIKKIGRDKAQCPQPLPIAAKNYPEEKSKCVGPVQFCLISLLFSVNFSVFLCLNKLFYIARPSFLQIFVLSPLYNIKVFQKCRMSKLKKRSIFSSFL